MLLLVSLNLHPIIEKLVRPVCVIIELKKSEINRLSKKYFNKRKKHSLKHKEENRAIFPCGSASPEFFCPGISITKKKKREKESRASPFRRLGFITIYQVRLFLTIRLCNLDHIRLIKSNRKKVSPFLLSVHTQALFVE